MGPLSVSLLEVNDKKYIFLLVIVNNRVETVRWILLKPFQTPRKLEEKTADMKGALNDDLPLCGITRPPYIQPRL